MLTKARLDEMKAQFALFDTDLSGTIERDECAQHGTALIQHSSGTVYTRASQCLCLSHRLLLS